MEWSDWIQDVAGKTINTVVEAEYKSPIDIQKMQLQLLGNLGQPYIEGSAATPAAVAAAQAQQTIFGIPMPLLLIGGLIFLLAKD